VSDFSSSEFFRLSVFRDGYAADEESLAVWAELAARYDRWRSGLALCDRPIPKLIHQIWIGKDLPEKYAVICESWKEMNPSFEYRMWDERSSLALGDFESRKAFARAKSLGAKSDIARYEILRRYGGIYADTDFECLRPFEGLADRCSFIVGNLFGPDPYLCNAIIGAAPGHPIIEELCRRTSKGIHSTEPMDVIEATGPGLLTKTVIGRLPELPVSDVVFPSVALYPYPNFAIVACGPDEIKDRFVADESYAIHYWHVSWSDVDIISFIIRKARRAVRKIRRLLAGKKDS